MGKDKIEDLFNEQLHSYHSEINTDELWNDISPSVDSRSTRKSMLIYILAAVGLIALLLLVGRSVMLSPDKQNVTLSQNNVSDDSFLSSEEVPKMNTVLKEKVEISSDSNSSISESIKDKETPQENPEKSSNITEVLPSSLSNIEKTAPIQDKSIQETLASHNKNDLTVDQNYLESTSNKTTNPKANNHSKKSPSNTSLNYEKFGQNQTPNDSFNKGFNNSIIVSNKKNAEALSSDKSAVVLKKQRYLLNDGFLLTSINQLNNQLSGVPSIDKDEMYQIEFSEEEKRYHSGKLINEGFSIGLQLMPLYSIPLFNSDSVSLKNYEKLRRSTEKYQEAFTIRASGMYQWKNGLYAQAAIDYGQIDERFEYYESTVDTVTGQVPTTIFINDNGQMDTIFGPGLVLRESYTDAKVYNYHGFIDISLGVGYQMPIQKNVSLYVDGNVGFNVASWHKGMIFSPEGIMEDIKKVPIYKNQLGFKINANLGVEWKKGALSYRIGPSIIYHTNNWLDDSNLLEQRYLKVGVHLGMRYSF